MRAICAVRHVHPCGDPLLLDDPELVAAEIVDAAVAVHRGVGAAVVESVYQRVLAWELERRGLAVERERRVRFEFGGHVFHHMLRVDLLVNGLVVVEIKSVRRLAPIHFKQVRSYLKLLDLSLALLLNFGAPTMRDQIKRVVNNHTPSDLSPLRIHRRPGPGRSGEQ